MNTDIAKFPNAEDLTVEDLTALLKENFSETATLEKSFNQTLNKKYLERGLYLTVAKSKLQRGQFDNWLADNFGLKRSSAYNYIAVFNRFGSEIVHARGRFTEVFDFRQLVELCTLPKGDEFKFLDELISNGTDVASLSLRGLQKLIHKFKGTVTIDTTPVTVEDNTGTSNVTPADDSTNSATPDATAVTDHAAETSTALVQVPHYQQLSLFEPLPNVPIEFKPAWLIPAPMVETATRAGLNIQLDFNKSVRPITDGLLVTKQTPSAMWFNRLYNDADAVILSISTLPFSRTDGTTKNFKFAIWIFNSDAAAIETFGKHFSAVGYFFLTKKNNAVRIGDNSKIYYKTL